MHFRFIITTILFLSSLETHAYDGSTFQEIAELIRDQRFAPISEDAKKEFAVYQEGNLPQYKMNYASVFGKGRDLGKDANRTINDRSDSFLRIEKLLHPNGVCVLGKWSMTEENPYSGYFRKGTSALFAGRISVAMEKTTSASDRGFGFAGKIFPTMNPEERVPTVNFFMVDILMGEHSPRFLETAVTNEPETGFNLRLIRLGLKISKILKMADQSPMFRPVSPIAKIKESDATVKSPKWMRITTSKGMILNDEVDFRHEIMKAVKANSVLKFKVDVSETTKDRRNDRGWSHVGFIEVNEARASYGCDRQLHFAHPRHND